MIGNSIQHRPWCNDHEFHDDGISWDCLRNF
jgi:hypothetical protein